MTTSNNTPALPLFIEERLTCCLKPVCCEIIEYSEAIPPSPLLQASCQALCERLVGKITLSTFLGERAVYQRAKCLSNGLKRSQSRSLSFPSLRNATEWLFSLRTKKNQYLRLKLRHTPPQLPSPHQASHAVWPVASLNFVR